MNCPVCNDTSQVRNIISKFNDLEYGHFFCAKCGISFDSNVDDVLDNYGELDNVGISELDEDDYRKYFIETSDITDGSDDIYASFNWDDQEQLKRGIVNHIQNQIDGVFSTDEELRILDIGCGNGFATILLSEIYPNATIVAVDPSPQINKLKNHEKIKPYQGILQNMEFDDKSFDVIIIFGNLMLHADPFETLKIVNNLLKDDGVLLFDFKNINSTSRVIAKNIGYLCFQSINRKNFIQRNFINMHYGLSREFMRKVCEDIGLTVKYSYSKPPRLLEYKNSSEQTQGIQGYIWQLLNFVDKSRDEMAWMQFTCIKTKGVFT